MDRVFLDANVLFSAAYSDDADFRRLWELPETELIVSTYVVNETLRNLPHQEQHDRLDQLLSDVLIVDEWEHIVLADNITLVEKDRPILQAAIAAEATHLITGDIRDFGHLFGQTITGVEILRPAAYLSARS